MKFKRYPILMIYCLNYMFDTLTKFLITQKKLVGLLRKTVIVLSNQQTTVDAA